MTDRLDIYRQLSPRWRNWTAVVDVCSGVAARMISEDWD
jgi:hypothetical protein